jgi:hypothetical protein
LVGATIVSVATLGVTAALAQPVPGGTLDPTIIPKYVQPLVIPPVMSSAGPNDYDIAVREFQQQILPGGHWNAVSPACIADATLCTLPATTVWSYGPAADPLPDSSGLAGGAVGLAPALNSQFNYPAFTVENEVDVPTTVDWINDLKDPATGRFLPHLLPIDQTLHWANPNADCIAGAPRTDCRGDSGQPYNGPVPIIVHVHGAHVDPESDGYPEAWHLPYPTGSNFSCVTDPAQAKGTKYVCQGSLANGYGATPNTNVTPGVGNFAYRNDQPSTTLWYHDHTLGMTRSNVYAGPAGFWLIREPGGGETGLVTGTLPGPAPKADDDPNFDPLTRGMIREIPVVIQDRSFNEDGSLFYPESRAFFEGVPDNQLNIRTLPNPRSDISPIWNPEAFFNTIVVNGTTWPLLEVEPERYRLRLLNGCNSRFLNVALKTVNPDGTLGYRAAGRDRHAGRRSAGGPVDGTGGAGRRDRRLQRHLSGHHDPHDQHRPRRPLWWLPGRAGGSFHHRSGDAVRGRGRQSGHGGQQHAAGQPGADPGGSGRPRRRSGSKRRGA